MQTGNLIGPVSGDGPGHTIRQEGSTTRRFWLRTTLAAALTAGLAAVVLHPHALRADVPPEDPIEFFALPNGSAEFPAQTDSRGTGFARFVLSADRTQLIYEIRVSGLSGPATRGMHLHMAPRGASAGVVVPFPDLDPDPAVANPLARGQAIGCVAVTPAVAAALMNQQIYLNIHTEKHPGGEIRGQVIPAP